MGRNIAPLAPAVQFGPDAGMKLGPAAFATALLIAAFSALINALDLQQGALAVGLPAAILDRLPYFTIWTNWMVMATFLWMVGTGRLAGNWWLGGLTLWIGITGAVFQLLLRGAPATGLHFWVDLAHHGLVPLLVLLWWLAFAPKWPMPWLNAVTWLVWPLLYCVAAVARGLVSHQWSYYFINVDELGWWPGFAQSVGQLLLAFFIAGLVLVAVARAIAGVTGENRRAQGQGR